MNNNNKKKFLIINKLIKPTLTTPIIKPVSQIIKPVSPIIKQTSRINKSILRLIKPARQIIKPTPPIIKSTPQIIKPTPQIISPTPQIIKPTPQIISPNNNTNNDNIFGFIEKVIYINLEKRKDRRVAIEKQLLLYFPSNKIVRFNAFFNERGYVGCSQSHIGALQMAINHKWKNCLILEDDIVYII